MSTNRETNRTSQSRVDTRPSPAAKKPYVKPAFRYEQVFETMALACGKVNATQSQCKFNKKS